jgi:uncharacterized protein (TIGR00661 family)
MKIIYGVSGEGFGHSSRAREMITYLQKQGHEILVITYGQAYPVLSKLFKTLKIEGIHLKFKKEGLSLSETIKHNFPFILKNIKTSEIRDETIKKFNPDIAITDYEPTTAIISYKFNIPLISIDNQHRLTHLNLEIPREYMKDYLLAKTATSLNPPKADKYIILSFAKLKPNAKDAYIVSPMLRKLITDLKPSKHNFILVYQTKPEKTLLSILKNIRANFIVYGYDKEKRDKNLIFKKAGEHFVKDLAASKAVIATSGFSLMSESLYLKKPYFAIPLKGQFEQTLNSLFLKKAGFGEFSEDPTEEQLKQFLRNLNIYEKNLKKFKTNPKEAFHVMNKLLKKLSNHKIR